MCTYFKANVLSISVNIATHMPAYQSCVHGGGAASFAVDLNYAGVLGTVSHTCEAYDNWWSVDLGRTVTVSKAALTNRLDCCREFHYFLS